MVSRLAVFLPLAFSDPSPNLPCKSMKQYMPPELIDTYNMSKHNGTWYEVSFRDLYPWGPLCECQQSVKYVNPEKGYIDDYFVFTCAQDILKKIPHPHFNYISPQRENVTNGGTGKKHPNGIMDMYVRYSDFHFIMNYEWNTEFIGFKDDGKDQYKWIIEYQCGTRPNLPKQLCLGSTASDGQCYFTGIQMYVRDLDFLEEGRNEMYAYMRKLGPEATKSEAAAWVMDDMSGGTFPRWFKNVTWNPKCPLPCKTGVYNETTKMWGCPSEGPRGEKIHIASPLDFTLGGLRGSDMIV